MLRPRTTAPPSPAFTCVVGRTVRRQLYAATGQSIFKDERSFVGLRGRPPIIVRKRAWRYISGGRPETRHSTQASISITGAGSSES